MAVTVDDLQIEIGASASAAVTQINNLVTALQDLRAATSSKFKNPLTSVTGGGNISRAEREVRSFGDTVAELHRKASSNGLSKFVKSLGRIAFYRAIRTAIKAVTQTISEGATNAYWYAKKYGDSTKYIADAYDNLSSQSYKMGNQLGAAWATLIATIQPIITQIISLVTRAAQVIAQFFALLGGKGTYMKAIDYTKQWGKATSGGAKAAKEWKNQLMGFDEINRLEEPSTGGGGGGGGMGDIGSMFEEAPLEEWTSKVKPILDWVKNHLDLIKELAIGVGAAILGWKIARLFTDDLSKLLGIAIGLGGATVYVQGFMDAWNNGPDWQNVAEMIGGAAVAAIGLGMAFGPVAAAITLLVTGIGMLVVGFRDWIKTGELSTKTFWLLEAGILAVGVAMALITGPIALVVAAVAGLALGIVQLWNKNEDFRNGVIKIWEDIKFAFQSAIFAIKDFVNDLKTTISTRFDQIKQKAGEVIEKIKEFFKFEWKFPHINLPHIKYDLITVPILGTIPNPKTLRIDWYAQGGFPEDGLFMANHGELVGKFSNGKTAVANNEQITQGIARAVYDAFMSATGGSGSGKDEKTIEIYLDGRQIARTTTQYQRQFARAEA